MFLKKGIECFKVSTENFNKDISVEIPDRFKHFLRTFQQGKEGLNEEYLIYDNDIIKLTCINYYNYDKGKKYENSLLYFNSLSNAIIGLDKKKTSDIEYHKFGLIEVGKFDIRDSILLGINEANWDQIWKLDGETGRYEKIEETIYDFMMNCQEELIQLNLVARKIDPAKLYRTLADKYWRLKYS
jgi:hypothetical protein